MRPVLLLGILVACAHPVVKQPTGAPPAPALRPDDPTWPVAVRVMTWGNAGVRQVGVFPDDPPSILPLTPWYVEPIGGPIDHATFTKLLAAIHEEHVPGLSMRGRAVAAWLGEIRALPDLAALVLDDTDVDGKALDALGADLPLHRIYLEHLAIDDPAVARLVRKFPKLAIVDLQGDAVGDPSVASLVTLADLEAIDLSGTGVTDAGGAQLVNAPKLNIVDLGRTAIGGPTLSALAKLPIRHLFIDDTQTGTELVRLAPLAATLERLDISGVEGGSRVADTQLGWLASASHLIEAGLDGAQIHDKLVRDIASIATLRELRIAESPITPHTAAFVATTRPELEDIGLVDTATDDAAAKLFLALPNLRIARFDHTKITDAGLRGPFGPALVQLFVSKNPITDAGIAPALDKLANLEALGVGNTAIGDASIDKIAKLVKLHTLVMTSVATKIPSAGFAKLGALHELERLYLQGAHAGDDSIAAWTALTKLRILHLEGSDVTTESFPILQSFAQLEELTLGDSRVRGIPDVTAWPRLRTLSLLGLAIGDAELSAIARAAGLVTLDLSSTNITDLTPLLPLVKLRTLGIVTTKLSPAGVAAAKTFRARGTNVVDR